MTISNGLILKVKVISARNLASKDRNGFSDPYAVVKIGDQGKTTVAQLKTLNPVWNATMVFNVTMKHATEQLRITVWDKDFIRKDFLGLVKIPISDIAKEGLSQIESLSPSGPVAQWHTLQPRSDKDVISGELCISTSWVEPLNLDLLKVIAKTAETGDGLEEQDSLSMLGSPDDTKSVMSNPDSIADPRAGVLSIYSEGAVDLPIGAMNSSDPVLDLVVAHKGKDVKKSVLLVQRRDTPRQLVANIHIQQDDFSNDGSMEVCLFDPTKSVLYHPPQKHAYKISTILSSTKRGLLIMNKLSENNLMEIRIPFNAHPSPSIKSYLILNVSFCSYSLLRRNFFMTFMKYYANSDQLDMDIISLTTMLDALGCTFSDDTIHSMFHQFGKSHLDKLSFEEIAQFVEDYLKSLPGSLSTSPTNETSDPVQKYKSVECLTTFSQCPLCNRELIHRNQVQILTHVSLCLSGDYSKIYAFVLGGVFSPSHLPKKWLSKLFVAGVGIFSHQKEKGLIVARNRVSGQLLEEKIPSYTRIVIRLLYQFIGSTSLKERESIRGLLKRLSSVQGAFFDSPTSVGLIPAFIAYHGIKASEMEDKIDTFHSLSEFSSRKLKREARLFAEDPTFFSAPADSRVVVFSDITKVTTYCPSFSLESLFGDRILAGMFHDSPMAIFRVLPSDSHRVYTPFSGKIVSIRALEGDAFPTDPLSVHSSFPVLSENSRTLLLMETQAPSFGRIALICVKDFLSGPVNLAAGVKEGMYLNRMDDVFYGSYGHLSVIVVFERGRMVFDADVIGYSKRGIETIVHLGERVGHVN